MSKASISMVGSCMKPPLCHCKSRVSLKGSSARLVWPKQECQPSHCLFWHLSTLTGQSWPWENLSKKLNRLTLELTHRNGKYSGFRSYLQFHVLICKINRIGNLVTAPGKLDWSNPLCKYQYNYPIPKNLYHYGTYKGYSTWAWQLACSLISPVN